MSVDWCSEIFVGALVGDVVTTMESTKTATKYNEDTGIPYSVVVKDLGTFVGSVKVDDLEEFLEENDLEILYANHNQKEETKIVGVEIISVGFDPEIVEIDMILLQNTISEVKAKFEQLGITVRPKVFLSNSVSY